jgi:hypothetical protein
MGREIEARTLVSEIGQSVDLPGNGPMWAPIFEARPMVAA